MQILKLFTSVTIIFSLSLGHTGCIATRSEVRSKNSIEDQEITIKDLLLSCFAFFDGSGSDSAKTLSLALEKRSLQSIKAEREIVIQILPLLKKYQAAPRSISSRDLGLIEKLMQQFSAIYPQDFALQLAIAKGLDRLENQSSDSKEANLKEARLSSMSLMKAEELVKLFPKQKSAFLHLAKILEKDSKDPLPSLRAYARCIDLDPEFTECRMGFMAIAKERLTPRCEEVKDQEFFMGAGFSKNKPGLKKISRLGQTVYREVKPSFTGKDIEAISVLSNKEINGKSEQNLEIQFTPKAMGRFVAWTYLLAKDQAYILVELGKEILPPIRVISGNDSGQFLVSTNHFPKEICGRYDPIHLPADLKRYAAKMR